MLTKPNLLIAGASGGVANALLHHLVIYRDLFGKIILLDRNKHVLDDIYIDHKRPGLYVCAHGAEVAG